MARRRELNEQEAARTRRMVVRKAARYALLFGTATVLVTLGGAALIALLLSTTGLPFLETWLVLSGIVTVAVLTIWLVQNRRNR